MRPKAKGVVGVQMSDMLHVLFAGTYALSRVFTLVQPSNGGITAWSPDS
jgi:hypothetical protein